MSLAEYVKKLRKEKKIDKPPTLQDVADGSGIPLSTLDFIERGATKRPSDDTLDKLAAYYEVDKKDLIHAMYELDE